MTTLRDIRQALGRAVDDLEVYAVSSATATTVVLDPIITSLSNASGRRFDDAFIYVNSGAGAGVQARIRPNGYVASTGTLSIMNSSGWNASLSVNDGIEITNLLACKHGAIGAGTTYLSCINRGLGHLAYPDHLDVTTVADQWEYSLSAYAPWLDRESRFLGVQDPARATGAPRRDSWRRSRLKIDGGTPTLQFLDRPYPVSGFTFQVVTMRPAFSLINGATSTVGLLADTDTTQAPLEDVVTASLPFVYEALMNKTPTRPAGDWEEKYATALGNARGLAAWDRTQEAQAAPAAGAA